MNRNRLRFRDLCSKSHFWGIWQDFFSSDISDHMSMPLWTLHLSSGVPCKCWVLPRNVTRLLLSQHLGLCTAPLAQQTPFGGWNTILNKPTLEACVETPASCRGYRDQGMTYPAEALETVLASCSRCNLTYPN